MNLLGALRVTRLVLPLLMGVPVLADEQSTNDWPQFHGPSACGVAAKPTPIEWNVGKGQNIIWNIEVPGLGHSSPVIWGDRLFLATAVGKGAQQLKPGLYGDPTSANDQGEMSWKVLCFDKNSGKLLWEQTAHTGIPQVKRHPKGTHANSTCCTDGKRVVAFFGSEGLYCYDMDGKPQWEKSFGLLDSGGFMSPASQWGFASSPVLHDGKLVVLADVQKAQNKSFLTILDASDGKEIWRIDRHDNPTWGTPTVYSEPGEKGRTMIFVNGYKEAAGYDFADGKKLWTIGGGGDVPVPTPVVARGLVFLTSAHGPQAPVYAVKLSAEGDLNPKTDAESSPHIAWQVRQGGNYMQTPFVVGDLLYMCRDNGVLSCFEAETGKLLYRQRLEGFGFTSSGVAAGDRVYFTSEDGMVNVLQAGREFKHLATNPLGQSCLSSPAISDGVLYIRTEKRLIAIGQKAS